MKPAALIVRCATDADIPAMQGLAAHAHSSGHWSPETYQGLFRPQGLPRLLLVVETVAAEATKVVAFVIVLCCGAEWEIENIAVSDGTRRRGIGDRLVSELLTRALAGGAEAVFLEVRESNQAARSLYEKKGFLEVGRRPTYYSDPREDAILYRCTLIDEKVAAKSLIPNDMK